MIEKSPLSDFSSDLENHLDDLMFTYGLKKLQIDWKIERPDGETMEDGFEMEVKSVQ